MKRKLIDLLYGIQELEFEKQAPYIDQIKWCILDKIDWFEYRGEPETFEAINVYYERLEELKNIIDKFDEVNNQKSFYELSQMILTYQCFYGGLRKYSIEMLK